MPHGHCYLWTPHLLWTFVVAESVITLSYFSISLALLYFAGRRKDIHFNWMFKLFALFIFACGITHLLDVWTIWHTAYWLQAIVTALTAILSLSATVLLWPLIPRALKLPSTQQLEASIAQLQQEVTRRKTIEAELARLQHNSDERYRVLFEQAAEGVAEIDTNTGTILRANRKFCSILGYERDEILSMNSVMLTHPDHLSAELQNMQALKEGRIREFMLEERCYRKDSSPVWIKLTVSPTWEPGALPSTHIAIIQDISIRKSAEENLQLKLDELQRWQSVTLEREGRVLDLKREVNELLVSSGKPARYASVMNDPA